MALESMEKQSDLYRQLCANGPMLERRGHPSSGPATCGRGCTHTIGTGLMLASTVCHRLAEAAYL